MQKMDIGLSSPAIRPRGFTPLQIVANIRSQAAGIRRGLPPTPLPVDNFRVVKAEDSKLIQQRGAGNALDRVIIHSAQRGADLLSRRRVLLPAMI